MENNEKKEKRKFKLMKKKILSGTLVAAIIVGGLAIHKVNKKEDANEIQNQIGHTDVSFTTNWLTHVVKNDEFVIMDVGDFNNFGKPFADIKMKYCIDNNISLGVIISTNSENLKGIYEDLDYAKAIVRDYKIDMPVYLGIDDIIENDSLQNDEKTKIIKSFCEKAASNGMYVGVYGKDKNLCIMKARCNITEYDAFLVMDSEAIKYDGTYNIIKKLDGTVESRFKIEKTGETDLSKVITNNALNNVSSFVNDKTVTISNDDIDNELLDISIDSGMSVQELLDFNEVRKKELLKGTELRIPTNIDASSPINTDSKSEKIISYEVEYIEDPSKWKRFCDVSKYINDGDWDKVQENFSAVIMRSNIGNEEDAKFSKFYNECSLRKIPIGAFCYNKVYASNFESVEEFEKSFISQVNFTLEVLKNKKISEPVFLDIEGPVDSTLFKNEEIGDECVRSMLRIWRDTMLKEGYIPGLYFSGCNGKYVSDCYNGSITEDFIVWVAGAKGNDYVTPTSLNDVKPTFDHLEQYVPNAHMCQPCDHTLGCGMANDFGYLDVDFSRVNIIKKRDMEQPHYVDSEIIIKESSKPFI